MSNEFGRLTIAVTAGDHLTGDPQASNVLVEYGDYQSHACREAYVVVVRLRHYFRERLAFVFRNFPVSSLNPAADNAARAAEAAALQGQFWRMHDMLYENQERLDPESLKAYAQKIGLDLKRFERDFDSPKIQERISADFYGGLQSQVNTTPTFFINGRLYAAVSVSYERLKEELEIHRV